MNKTKIWIITALCLILIGSVIFGGVMMALKRDFNKLSTAKLINNEYDVSEAFSNISIKTDTADVEFILTDGESRVELLEYENERHSVFSENGTLTINVENTKKWYDHIGINIGSPSIKVYIPKKDYESVSVMASTGRIFIEGLAANELKANVSTGEITLKNVECNVLSSTGSTGGVKLDGITANKTLTIKRSTGYIKAKSISAADAVISVTTGKVTLQNVSCSTLSSDGKTGRMDLQQVVATKKLTLTRSTGDIKMDDCDAGEIYIKTSTGDVKGSLLSEKIFITKTDTGNISVPSGFAGGKCEIETSTGDIKITIK